MIHRSCHIALFAVTLLGMLPGVTYADGLISWLGKLSGPGPFIGANVDVCVKPFFVDPKAKAGGPEVAAGLIISCSDTRLNDQHLSWYVGAGFGLAYENNLNYSGRSVEGLSERVMFYRVGTSLMYTVHPAVDLGMGTGVMIFNGPRFEAFPMPYLQPVKLALRPLLLRDRTGRTDNQIDARGWLVVTANWTLLLGTLDGADFGAPNDPLLVRNENLPQFGVAIDVPRLLRAFKRERAGR
jgi:hypothetical protein